MSELKMILNWGDDTQVCHYHKTNWFSCYLTSQSGYWNAGIGSKDGGRGKRVCKLRHRHRRTSVSCHLSYPLSLSQSPFPSHVWVYHESMIRVRLLPTCEYMYPLPRWLLEFMDWVGSLLGNLQPRHSGPSESQHVSHAMRRRKRTIPAMHD